MWTSISTSCYQNITNHAATLYPEEACGVLLAPEGSSSIIKSIAIDNVHRNKGNNFAFDPEQWIHAFFLAQQQGLMIAGIYHSHPTTEAFPSIEDMTGWVDDKLLYAIISLKQKDSPQINFFRKTGTYQFATCSLSLT